MSDIITNLPLVEINFRHVFSQVSVACLKDQLTHGGQKPYHSWSRSPPLEQTNIPHRQTSPGLQNAC